MTTRSPYQAAVSGRAGRAFQGGRVLGQTTVVDGCPARSALTVRAVVQPAERRIHVVEEAVDGVDGLLRARRPYTMVRTVGEDGVAG
jgi:hypothetical protein